MPFSSSQFVPALVALALSLALTPLVRAFARRYGVIARPRSDRFSSRPTAMMGGVAIYLSVLVAFLLFVPHTREGWVVMGASTALFLVGLVDDFLHIKPYQKLIGQVLGASAVVYFGLLLPWGWGASAAMASDHLLAHRHHQRHQPARQHGRAGRGHLRHRGRLHRRQLRRQRADDRGRDALGLRRGARRLPRLQLQPGVDLHGRLRVDVRRLLSRVARRCFRPRASAAAASSSSSPSPSSSSSFPIFDTTLVTVVRKLSGRAASQGGRDHTSHRLVALGLSERRAVWMLYAFAGASGLLAMMVRQFEYHTGHCDGAGVRRRADAHRRLPRGRQGLRRGRGAGRAREAARLVPRRSLLQAPHLRGAARRAARHPGVLLRLRDCSSAPTSRRRCGGSSSRPSPSSSSSR